LQHGLDPEEAAWLMQYQYPHGAFDYQRPADTSRNWNIMPEVKAGDWLVAYCRDVTFYAVGEVIGPRTRSRHSGATQNSDTVQQTVQRQGHLYLSGLVRYEDAPVFYEDFTDPWRHPLSPPRPGQPSAWLYPQRIDVRAWENVVTGGVRVPGMSDHVPFPDFRNAAFVIPEKYFQEIVAALQT
jgi:hypothetical protein